MDLNFLEYFKELENMEPLKAGYTDFENTHQYTPERRLHAAVLVRAILDLTSPEVNIRKYAKQWFFDVKNNKEAITLKKCCLVLDIKPKELLLRLVKQGFLDERLGGKRAGVIKKAFSVTNARITSEKTMNKKVHVK